MRGERGAPLDRAVHGVDMARYAPEAGLPPMLSSQGLGWPEGFHAEHYRHYSYPELEQPPLADHVVALGGGRGYGIAYRHGDGDGQLRKDRHVPWGTVLIPAGKPNRYVYGGEGSDVFHVRLSPGLVRGVAEAAGLNPEGFEFSFGPVRRDPFVEHAGRALRAELENAGAGSALYVEGLARALTVHLLREYSSLAEKAKRRVGRQPNGGLTARQLRAATDHIGDNLSGDISLAGIARAANLSERHLLRLFKEATGLSPHRYVIRERVERAKSLLLRGELSVARVARECGFHDQAHLTRHVKVLLGVTPGRILKEGREDGRNVQKEGRILQDPGA